MEDSTEEVHLTMDMFHLLSFLVLEMRLLKVLICHELSLFLKLRRNLAQLTLCIF